MCPPLPVPLVRLGFPGISHDFWGPKRQQSPPGIQKPSNLVFSRKNNYKKKNNKIKELLLTHGSPSCTLGTGHYVMVSPAVTPVD